MVSSHEIRWHRRRLALVLDLSMVMLLALGPVGVVAVPSAAAPAGPLGHDGRWHWPLRPAPVVARPFDGPAAPWLPGHRGADLRAAPGQAVLAPVGGTVSFAGTVVDRGVLTIEHAGGLRTSYEPVAASVARGDVVTTGQQVAVVAGAGHCAPASCLHWGLRRGDVYLDPLLLVRPRQPPVLLPWRGSVGKTMPSPWARQARWG